MKILGLIGGISWLSTIDYYRLINKGINDRLGGLNFSNCIIYSFNFADIKKNNDANDWDSTFQMVSEACKHMKSAGAAGIILCANTMHLIAERVEQAVGLPVIHIASETAKEINLKGLKKVGLLGTKFTMELDFFTSKLEEKGIEVIIPGSDEREFIAWTIYEELGRGIVTPSTKARYLAISQELISKGAEGIILGCTEIPMVIEPQDLEVPVFDTTLIHSAAAVQFSLSGE